MPALGTDTEPIGSVGAKGNINAKLRLVTQQLDNILTSVKETVTSGMLQTGAVATGSGTIVDLRGVHDFALHVTGITSGTVTFQGSIDGSNWFNVAMRQSTQTAQATLVATATDASNGVYVLPADYALGWFRANVTAYVSGTINVLYRLVDNFAWGH